MAPAGQEEPGRTFNVLYLFSGEERKSSTGSQLRELASKRSGTFSGTQTTTSRIRANDRVARGVVTGDLGQSFRTQASTRRSKALGVPVALSEAGG